MDFLASLSMLLPESTGIGIHMFVGIGGLLADRRRGRLNARGH
jgi:hypothetical protein